MAAKGRPASNPTSACLREAYQAHLRGDLKQEEALHKRVLNLLRTERPSSDQWLTGSPASDQRLQQQIENPSQDRGLKSLWSPTGATKSSTPSPPAISPRSTARDRELGREVAIKQIHQQFLGNPRQLERYWHEAQLLASLQHPNIVTIYDIVRSRGWLILELMRGTLQKSVETGPIDLDFLRASLVYCLDALSFLHTNGVIHGDVKPSNMLVDVQGRVKLGDFGLARRASSQQGSLLKGTTKYMAPEMVSDQFGPVGPASDLYSVGFSAYELMCGPQFDSLFPGLATFGRDKQIAWLMWHAAPDRKLPPVARVLEGVPEDLAHVIERLSTKEQAGRYQSAKAALRDLRAGESKAAGGPAAVDEPEPSDRRKRLTRIAAVGAAVCSVVLCAAMLFWPSAKPPRVIATPEPIQGVITNVYPRDPSIEVQYGEKDKRLKSFLLREGKTAVLINQKVSLPKHLQKDDRVRVEYHADASGRDLADEVRAARPEKQAGTIQAVDTAAGQFTLAVIPGDERIDIRVPDDLARDGKFLFNGKDKLAGKPLRFTDLRPGDRVTVDHIPDDLQAEKDRYVATDLSVLREVTSDGIVRKVSETELVIEMPGGQSESWPLTKATAIWINQGNTLAQKALTWKDLQGGDKAKVTHDAHAVRVDAERTIAVDGAVIQAVQSKVLEVKPQGGAKPISFLTDAATKITLAGEPADVAALRAGDVVDLTHTSALDSPTPLAISVVARRTADLTRWAVLVGIQKYDDATLPAPPTAAADARLLQETMIKRYGVPPDQALLLEDASLARLKEGIAGLLDRVTPEGKLVVYFAGHALRDDEGKVFLTPREFNPGKPAATGLALQWLVDRMEECKAKEKLLLLDACQASPGADPQKEPSTAEMLQSLAAPAGMAALRTVTGIASCSEGQRGYTLSDGKEGLFAAALAEGFSGAADKNQDGRIEATELFAFVGDTMTASARSIQKAQTPKLFLADNRPPRLSEAARKAIRDLAALLQQDTVNRDERQAPV